MPKSAIADLGAERGSPESITTVRDYGFRARRFAAPRNDSGEIGASYIMLRRGSPTGIGGRGTSASGRGTAASGRSLVTGRSFVRSFDEGSQDGTSLRRANSGRSASAALGAGAADGSRGSAASAAGGGTIGTVGVLRILGVPPATVVEGRIGSGSAARGLASTTCSGF